MKTSQDKPPAPQLEAGDLVVYEGNLAVILEPVIYLTTAMRGVKANDWKYKVRWIDDSEIRRLKRLGRRSRKSCYVTESEVSLANGAEEQAYLNTLSVVTGGSPVKPGGYIRFESHSKGRGKYSRGDIGRVIYLSSGKTVFRRYSIWAIALQDSHTRSGVRFVAAEEFMFSVINPLTALAMEAGV